MITYTPNSFGTENFNPELFLQACLEVNENSKHSFVEGILNDLEESIDTIFEYSDEVVDACNMLFHIEEDIREGKNVNKRDLNSFHSSIKLLINK